MGISRWEEIAEDRKEWRKIVIAAKRLFLHPLYVIYNLSIKSNKFPTQWKISKVSPIYKNGSKDEIANYRQVSVLSAFAKIYEQLLYIKIYNHVDQAISTKQHGFVKKRSTVTNLIIFTTDVCLALDDQ